MHKVHQEKILPFSHLQICELVKDVQKYPDFLPWCVGARIYEQNADDFKADLIIKFKIFEEKYSSKVCLTKINERKLQIDIEYLDGPFSILNNSWQFIAISANKCQVIFNLEFAFANKILDKLISLIFEQAVSKMITAFELRAIEIYGNTTR